MSIKLHTRNTIHYNVLLEAQKQKSPFLAHQAAYAATHTHALNKPFYHRDWDHHVAPIWACLPKKENNFFFAKHPVYPIHTSQARGLFLKSEISEGRAVFVDQETAV
jgi:hypothetical protein